MAILESHYFATGGFDPEDRLIRDVDRIRHIPTVIVHGRYDMVCPIDQAVELSERWSEAELKVISDAGHAVTEHGISRALVSCCNEMLEMVR